ncbi:MAG: 2-oxo acid dehydrogenase subunit E2 [Oscillospiraceae bacterium]|nr:2-oxo acid dehydrogenase subunit E2 [Oscillospiraceae bacterium]
MNDTKRHIGDRRDGTLLRDIDSMHIIMPMIYPNRCDNEAFISERIDLTNVDAYIAKRNAENPVFKFTLFHLIVAAILKVIVLRPKLNRFIANKNLYQRKELSASFVIKKQFNDASEEGMAFIRANGDSTLDTLREDLYKQITRVKKGGTDSTMDAMEFLKKLPRFVVKFFIALMRWCDRHGIVPKSLIASDPYYASVILSNLGSIKLRSGYHHLTNWGTTSLFVVVGEMKKRPFYDDEGNAEFRNSVDLGLTIDERLADGYYYSKSVRMLKYILEHPECLEKPFNEPVEY